METLAAILKVLLELRDRRERLALKALQEQTAPKDLLGLKDLLDPKD